MTNLKLVAEKKWLLGIAMIPICLLIASTHAFASQVAREWFFGKWDCNIDGRPAKMEWNVVDKSRNICTYGEGENYCTRQNAVGIEGKFNDSGRGWVSLEKRFSNKNELGIRYLGSEPNNWYLKYNPTKRVASGWTTWQGQHYPLQCRRQPLIRLRDR